MCEGKPGSPSQDAGAKVSGLPATEGSNSCQFSVIWAFGRNLSCQMPIWPAAARPSDAKSRRPSGDGGFCHIRTNGYSTVRLGPGSRRAPRTRPGAVRLAVLGRPYRRRRPGRCSLSGPAVCLGCRLRSRACHPPGCTPSDWYRPQRLGPAPCRGLASVARPLLQPVQAAGCRRFTQLRYRYLSAARWSETPAA